MAPSLIKQKALLEIFPEKELLRVETEIKLLNVDLAEIEFILAVRTPRSSGKFDILEITQEGHPCKYRIIPDRLYVIPNYVDEKIELVIKYEGKARQDFDDYIKKDEIILRMDGAWLPVIPSSLLEFDITLTHPSNYIFWGQGVKKKSKRINNKFTQSQWNIKAVNGFTLYGAPEYKIKVSKIGDTKLIIALWPEDSKLLLDLSKKTTTILNKLRDFLGEYPYPVIRIVESGRWQGKSGYGAISNISIGYQMLRDGINESALAHELSHGWWGGIVPYSHESLYRGQWNETLAEYSSIFALEKNIATETRKKWSINYARLDEEFDASLLEIGSYSTPNWRINEAITYHKGALLMTHLEDRVGLPSMIETLTKFIQDRKGKPSTWNHFINVLTETCGKETSEWFRKWLTMKLAPELKLSDLKNINGNISGKIKNTKSKHKGFVEIGCYNGDELLQIHLIPFDENETQFRFFQQSKTNRLIIDPRNRLPRRYNPEVNPFEDGREVHF
jgi:hypothetical protein